MDVLERQLRKSKLNPATFIGGAVLACLVFVSMGVTQLNIEFTPPEEPQPLSDFYIPPPPPPPPAKTPPKKSVTSMSFSIPVSEGEGEFPIGFLEVDFGLTPRKLTEANFDTPDSISDYETDGLEDLTVYDYSEVSEKPSTRYQPPLKIPSKVIGNTRKPVPFTYICRVNTDGRATDIHIIDTPYPEAIPYMLEFVKGIRFNVAKKDGKPVSCLVRRKGNYHPAGSGSPFSI